MNFQHQERDYTLKFSAMEIYNEAVRDLLSSDSTPLRLLDDPEVKCRQFIIQSLVYPATNFARTPEVHTENVHSCAERDRRGETHRGNIAGLEPFP